MLKLSKKYSETLSELVEEHNFKITDTHTHPLEVMNVIESGDYTKEEDNLYRWKKANQSYQLIKEGFQKGDVLINLNHNGIDRVLTKFAFNNLPSIVDKSIKDSYSFIGKNRFLNEMDVSRITTSVLLSVPPYNPIDEIFEYYGRSERLHYLGSVDIHKIESSAIEDEIKRQIREFSIIGIKLHPNLQGFYPVPDKNSTTIAERLDILYNTASKYNLYILMHGGTSNIVKEKYQSSKYSHMLRVAGGHYGLIENYCDKFGNSEIFGSYGCKFVIAHIGNYAIANPEIKRLAKAFDKYNNVFTDTSSVNSELIKNAINRLDTDRIFFGSDGLYNKFINEVYICMEGIEKAGKSRSVFIKNCKNIFNQNFEKFIL